MAVGESLRCVEMEAKSHTTHPPDRFSEAALTKALEERGIGRPSTYASIIDTIQARNYVFKKGGALVPTWVAFSVVKLLEEHLANLVDYQFTAQMEDDLDAISRGEREHVDYLRAFYFGNGTPGLKPQLAEQGRRDRRPRHQPHPHRHAGGRRAGVRPRGAVFAVCGAGRTDRVAAEDMPPDEVTLEMARCTLLEQAGKAEEPLGTCPETRQARVSEGWPLWAVRAARHAGRRREAAKRLAAERHERRKTSTLATALKLLTLPRNLGDHPQQASR